MRKILLKIHSYSGLICFWYLIILGTSSLEFNHSFSFMESDDEKEFWSREVRLNYGFADDLVLSETLRDSLALIGWPLPWEMWHDSTGVFHFALEHPGKRYVVDYIFADGVANVQETPKANWRIFNAMHGIGSVPNSSFMVVWKWYTRITAVLVIFSLIAGIYLWYDAKRDRKPGWYTLFISLAVSLAWMFYMYLRG